MVAWLVGLATLLASDARAQEAPRCLDDSPLHRAVARGDLPAVLALVGDQPSLRAMPNALGDTPLGLAARAGDVAIVRALLGGVGPELEATDAWGATPLTRALWSGRETVARLLLAAGADARAATSDGVTPLHAAGRRGLGGIVGALANAVARAATDPRDRPRRIAEALEARDAHALTPLDEAALSGSEGTVRALLGLGAHVRPETLAAACGLARVQLVRGLAESVAPPRALDAALALALGDGGAAPTDSLAVSCLLDAGAVPGPAAFRLALARGRRDLAALFALRGASSAGDAEQGDTMLHAAAEAGDVAFVQALLALGAAREAVDAEGATPLHRAILANKPDTVRALLAAGADATTTFGGVAARGLALRVAAPELVRAVADKLGLDALSAAALDDAAGLARLLQADPGAATRAGEDGLAPIHVAARFGAGKSIEALLAAGVSIDMPVAQGVRDGERDLSGWTALHFAAFHGHAELFRQLLGRGAVDSPAADGETAKARATFALSDVVSEAWKNKERDPDDEMYEGMPPPPNSSSGVRVRVVLGQGIGEAGSARPSFIDLGGGLLRDERRLDEEVVPARTLVADEPEGDTRPWAEALGQCMARGHWSEAERVARDLVNARAIAPLPVRAQGFAWHGQKLLSASSLQSLGRVLVERGRFKEAEARFDAAASALATLPLPAASAQILPEHRVLHALAEGRARLRVRTRQLDLAPGEPEGALPRFDGDALAPLRAGLLGRLALVLGEAARYGQAIAYAREALRLIEGGQAAAAASPGTDVHGWDEAPSPHVVRYNLATLLGRAGEREEARSLIEAELDRVVSGDVTDVEDWAMIRYAAGLWRMIDGAYDAGEDLIVSARDGLEVAFPEHPALGRFDLGLGLALSDLGRNAEAAFILERGRNALLVSEGASDFDALSTSAAVDVARIDAARAAVMRQLGQLDDAFALARSAYAVVVGAEALEARWPIELELARIEAARGHLGVAIFFGKRAVKTLDRIRGRGVPKALAHAFVGDRLAAWRELADHLIEAGRLLEATAALSALKDDEAEGLATRGGRADDVAQNAPGRATPQLPEVGPELKGDRGERPLEAAQRQADKLAGGALAKDPTAAELDRIEQARKALRERRRAFESWLEALEAELGKLAPERARAIAAMNLRDLAGLQGTLAELGSGVVLLHYLLTEDRVRVIVTTPAGQVGRESPIRQGDLNALIFQFREVLADPARDPRAAARALYDVLIAPIVADLAEAKAETLLVSLDGALRYAPMAALWDGKGWLVERYRIVYFARAALDKIMAGRPPAETLAAFGCGRLVPGFQELKAVPAELESIVKRDANDPDGELPGVVKLDDAFSRESLTSLLEGKRYTAVHIASHFVLGPEGESDSYLLLGDGSRLTLEDMRYDLRFDGVDLLSLSACNTALGEDKSDGRELEGFASLALRLGARAVLATLWPVNDASTGLFMRTLYRLIRGEPTRSRADVLREAMLAFIHGDVTVKDENAIMARGPRPLAGASAADRPPEAPATVDLRHPRYWAPFVFIGNWR